MEVELWLQDAPQEAALAARLGGPPVRVRDALCVDPDELAAFAASLDTSFLNVFNQVRSWGCDSWGGGASGERFPAARRCGLRQCHHIPSSHSRHGSHLRAPPLPHPPPPAPQPCGYYALREFLTGEHERRVLRFVGHATEYRMTQDAPSRLRR